MEVGEDSWLWKTRHAAEYILETCRQFFIQTQLNFLGRDYVGGGPSAHIPKIEEYSFSFDLFVCGLWLMSEGELSD